MFFRITIILSLAVIFIVLAAYIISVAKVLLPLLLLVIVNVAIFIIVIHGKKNKK